MKYCKIILLYYFCINTQIACAETINKNGSLNESNLIENTTSFAQALSNCYVSEKLENYGLIDWLHKSRKKLAELDKCEKDLSLEHCTKRLVKLDNAPLKPDSKFQRVLVIDAGDYTRLHYRYPDRVLAQYRLNQVTLQYEKANKSIEVLSFFDDFMQQLTALPYPVPPLALGCLSSNLLSISSDAFDGVDPNEIKSETLSGHGNDIAGFIAEYSPSAQFVFADLLMPSRAAICSMGSLNSKVWERAFKAETVKQTLSIKKIIKKYDINFINFSAGDSSKTINQYFSHYKCNSDLPAKETILKYLEIITNNFYQPLSTMKNVAFVQASVNTSYQIETSNPNFLPDCKNFNGRLRVNQFGEEHALLKNHILPASYNDYNIGPNIHARSCSDIYINSGHTGAIAVDIINNLENTLNLYRLNSDGLRSSPMWAATSSFTAPIATSMLLYNVKQKIYQNSNYNFDSFVLIQEYKKISNYSFYHDDEILYDPRVSHTLELCGTDPVYCDSSQLKETVLANSIIKIKAVQ